jgi:uncharacterized protein (DUF488 family)
VGSRVFSLGHSDLSLEEFGRLLVAGGVTAIADVRSAPWSRRSPWFNRRALEAELPPLGIQYRFLGKELGGRPSSPELYNHGIADYQAMVHSSDFQAGIKRLLTGSRDYSIALVCSERDPLHCHRCLLVGRELKRRDVEVIHLHHDGAMESQTDAELRLLREEGMDLDFEIPLNYRLTRAYERRSNRVAFSVGRPSEPQLEL